jgi:hypothetical protein
MTLEENIQQMRDSLAVNSAMTLRHQTRVKEHQEWLEQVELAFARMAASHEAHERDMAQIAKADSDRGRALDERIDGLAREGRALDGRIDKLVSAIGELIRTRNGH